MFPTKSLPAVPDPPAVPVHPLITKAVAPVQVTALLFAKMSECAFVPKSRVLDAVIPSVLDEVKLDEAAIPVVLNLPPFRTTGEANVPVVVLGFNRSSPAVIVVVPEYVLAV